jgi:predicted ABC-type ATPase
MSEIKPSLTIIAGCNGAGKSTFAKSLLREDCSYFNFDVNFLTHKSELPDYFEEKEEIAYRKAQNDWQEFLDEHQTNGTSFSYETNYDAYPSKAPLRFKNLGYELNMVFFCVADKTTCRNRIEERAAFNELYIPLDLFEYKWEYGYKNFDENFSLFDNVLIVDNSVQFEVFTPVVQFKDKELEFCQHQLPDYFDERLPTIYEAIQEYTSQQDYGR